MAERRSSPKTVEQFEVIERTVTEGRRPIPPGGRISEPFTSVRTTSESYERTEGSNDPNRRFEITGERDVSREPSFLHTSHNYDPSSALPPPPLEAEFRRLSEEILSRSRQPSVQSYGYDIHEVHTTEGGARIVETHGGGPIIDRLNSSSSFGAGRVSSGSQIERPGISSALRSSSAVRSGSTVYTVPVPAIKSSSWRDMNEPFVRQDSYRKMQASQEAVGSREASKNYATRSDTSLMTAGSTPSRQVKRSPLPPPGDSCWQRFKYQCAYIWNALRTGDASPELLANLCCILLFLILFLILCFIVFGALITRYSVREFLLFPPVCEECRRRNPGLVTAQLPSSLYTHYYSANQAHFELRGNAPFKSNSFTAVDFATGFVAIADHALTDAQGRHTTCFVMPLDRSALPSMDAFLDALDNSYKEIQGQFGWQEYWQWELEPLDPLQVHSKFSDPIRDCEHARWYLMKQTVYTRDSSCSDCYDFCLPDYAVQRRQKYEDETTIGIRRLNCFRLYIPEWREYAVTPDPQGGHWKYPLASVSTKRDEHGNWVSWVPTRPGYGNQPVQDQQWGDSTFSQGRK